MCVEVGRRRKSEQERSEQCEFYNGFLLRCGFIGLIICFLPHTLTLILPLPYLLYCHQGAQFSNYLLLPHNNLQIYFFSLPNLQLSDRLSDSLFSPTFFFLALYSFPPASNSVYQKFAIADSTNPFEHPGERKIQQGHELLF